MPCSNEFQFFLSPGKYIRIVYIRILMDPLDKTIDEVVKAIFADPVIQALEFYKDIPGGWAAYLHSIE
jgi:hypothetical protein